MKHGMVVSDWDPGQGKGKSSTDKLMSTSARENPENVSESNELKQFMGKGGTPKGPFGKKGREF